MGLFRDLGRRAEKLKREATEAARESADYECADCGSAVFAEREACPDCGGPLVERDAGDASDESTTSGDPDTDSANGEGT